MRDFGDAIEASLAQLPSAIDLRDLYRPRSGLTLRRLGVLIMALPAEAPLWEKVRAEHERSLKPTVEQLRARQAHYAQLKA